MKQRWTINALELHDPIVVSSTFVHSDVYHGIGDRNAFDDGKIPCTFKMRGYVFIQFKS